MGGANTIFANLPHMELASGLTVPLFGQRATPNAENLEFRNGVLLCFGWLPAIPPARVHMWTVTGGNSRQTACLPNMGSHAWPETKEAASVGGLFRFLIPLRKR